MNVKNALIKFWDFLHEDSWTSLFATLLIAFIVIKFIFFPTLSFVTGTTLPVVIVESCSMYHDEQGFKAVFSSPLYEKNNLYLNDTSKWIFQNGFSKGDVIFVVRPKNIQVGDVIIFEAGTRNPIIHRVISVEENSYSTKGDNYKTNMGQLSNEVSISEEQLIGKALFKVPALGWVKLIFFEFGRPTNERGLC